MSDTTIVNESRTLRELLNSKQEAFFQLSSQFDELSAFVSNLRNEHTRLTNESNALIASNEVGEKRKKQLQEDIDNLQERRAEIQHAFDYMQEYVTDYKDIEAKYAAICTQLKQKESECAAVAQQLEDLRAETHEVQVQREQMSERLDYYREQVKERKDYIESVDEKFRQAEKAEARAKKLQEENKRLLVEVEKKKNDFIEKPQSFGSYVARIKAKTGVDILELMRKNNIT